MSNYLVVGDVDYEFEDEDTIDAFLTRNLLIESDKSGTPISSVGATMAAVEEEVEEDTDDDAEEDEEELEDDRYFTLNPSATYTAADVENLLSSV